MIIRRRTNGMGDGIRVGGTAVGNEIGKSFFMSTVTVYPFIIVFRSPRTAFVAASSLELSIKKH